MCTDIVAFFMINRFEFAYGILTNNACTVHQNSLYFIAVSSTGWMDAGKTLVWVDEVEWMSRCREPIQNIGWNIISERMNKVEGEVTELSDWRRGGPPPIPPLARR